MQSINKEIMYINFKRHLAEQNPGLTHEQYQTIIKAFCDAVEY